MSISVSPSRKQLITLIKARRPFKLRIPGAAIIVTPNYNCEAYSNALAGDIIAIIHGNWLDIAQIVTDVAWCNKKRGWYYTVNNFHRLTEMAGKRGSSAPLQNVACTFKVLKWLDAKPT